MTTIAAIATPKATGGISMVRISGECAKSVAERVFKTASGKEVARIKSHTASYGYIYDAESPLRSAEKIDDGVLTLFLAPNSYTGEDVAEITCHGGIYVTERVLRACLDAGARLAGAGEFTKRALLNGKLSLTQAEAVIDVINSQTKQYLNYSIAQREGALYKKIKKISEIILDITVQIAAWLDYPDESLNSFEINSFLGQLNYCQVKLKALIESFEVGRILREGVLTAIVGKPNTGKSTIMNLLAKTERSIVTDIAGTTRDIIEESVNIGDAVLRLCDCAGFREAGDEVEKIGVDIMLKRLTECELVLAVFDNSKELEKDDYLLLDKLQNENIVCIINKVDLERRLDVNVLKMRFKNIVSISAKNSEDFEPLAQAISKSLKLSRVDMSTGFIANERQRECAKAAEALLLEAVSGINSGITLDALGVTLESALESLYELSGKSVSETVIDEVFKRFCVGK